jgi:site-specific DNA-methyltransferase (adenine-specific)
VIINGNALSVPLADESVDTIITDPPYGLTFMGKDWDRGVPGEPFWREAFRVAKPGTFLLAFGGTRTFHRLTCAIEDAGWEVRDCMMWLYGSGFPKSHNLKGEFKGYGTALKPAWEPIIVAMKPLDGTFAHNAEAHGVAGLWIDGGRIGTSDGYSENAVTQGINTSRTSYAPAYVRRKFVPSPSGRWPANLILDEAAGGMLDAQIEGASRFFYCAKASKAEREAGLRDGGVGALRDGGRKTTAPRANHHPTVKPVSLMRYLVRLTKTPTGGVVLDPFCGSGTTGVACAMEGRDFVGIELNPEYAKIARRRCEHAHEKKKPNSTATQCSLLGAMTDTMKKNPVS